VLLDQVLRERLPEGVNGALGRAVIEKFFAAFEPDDRAGVDDGATETAAVGAFWYRPSGFLALRKKRGVGRAVTETDWDVARHRPGSDIYSLFLCVDA
jgi:hypothetical protein